ncbi:MULTISPECIES: hypothetical protein [Thalassospira]|uniref:Uncharacterized protein n=4 Tax=Thalassospira TaxID=168934 RepID=A0ABR5XYC1_9PROT|nr:MULTISPECIES: hypothetical protein [Thalassospira]KZD01159.1 hypothetical protein AUP40_20785 [Thalassospira xiamenensis]MBR9818465.1 hypothetical protein [Rhodospirillales bacterium]QPL36772.1 hypothetical protein IT971_05530 [Thalassospira sp. B30-1]
MPRISGPELRPDWIGTGSAAGLPGVAGGERLAGSVASGLVVRSEVPKGWSSMAGFVCLPCDNAVALWGEVRLRRQPRASGVCSGQRGPSGAWSVRSVAFGNAGGSGVGWLDWPSD